MCLLLHDFRASPAPGLAGGFFLLDPDAALLEQFALQCQLHVTCLQVLPEASQSKMLSPFFRLYELVSYFL